MLGHFPRLREFFHRHKAKRSRGFIFDGDILLANQLLKFLERQVKEMLMDAKYSRYVDSSTKIVHKS